MFDHLFTTLKTALARRWNGRLGGVVASGVLAETSGMTPREAYEEGYQAAYFDAVTDLISEGFIREPVVSLPVAFPNPLTEEAH